MERTLCIQVLGATGSGKTKLLALITTLLRKEGVLIVGTAQEGVCSESVQVKFDAEAHETRSRKTLAGMKKLEIRYDDGSVLTLDITNKVVEYEGGRTYVFQHKPAYICREFEVGKEGVFAILAH
jgi:nucleoside-triphosphatase THEP1